MKIAAFIIGVLSLLILAFLISKGYYDFLAEKIILYALLFGIFLIISATTFFSMRTITIKTIQIIPTKMKLRKQNYDIDFEDEETITEEDQPTNMYILPKK